MEDDGIYRGALLIWLEQEDYSTTGFGTGCGDDQPGAGKLEPSSQPWQNAEHGLVCLTMAWRYGAADPFIAMCANTRDSEVVWAASGSQRKGLYDRVNMKEFGEVWDKTDCSLWDEFWGLKELFQETDYKKIRVEILWLKDLLSACRWYICFERCCSVNLQDQVVDVIAWLLRITLKFKAFSLLELKFFFFTYFHMVWL